MVSINSSVIKESDLGYTKYTRRQTLSHTNSSTPGVDLSSRFKRSASYRDHIIPILNSMDIDDGPGPALSHQGSRPERLNAILARAKEEDKNRPKRKNAVSIPTATLSTYTFAPRNDAGLAKMNASVDHDIESRKKNAERLRSLTRKVAGK